MKLNPTHFGNLSERQVLIAYSALMLVAMMATSNLHGGTDITFTNPTTMLTGWINGSYGKMAALAALGVGLAVAIIKQSLMFVAGAVGVAIVATQGPGIINGIVTATL